MLKLKDALDFLLPGVCRFCGDRTRVIPGICDPCARVLPRNRVCCPRCANPTPAPSLCPECLVKPPYFSKTVCPFLYADATRELVSSAKFLRDLSALASMGHLLGSHLATFTHTRPDVVIPVPLHPTRLRARGFNQAMEIAKVITRYVPVEVDTRICKRLFATVPQSSLKNLKERRRNVRGAFTTGRIAAGIQRVALVDDVMTTGTTLGELARSLVRAGVSSVELWVFARATSNN